MASKKDDYHGVPVQDGGHELDDLDGDHRPGSPCSPSLLARRDRAGSAGAGQPANPLSTIANNPTASILGYCLASISMTVVNKYVVSGSDWNLMFLYLAIQSIVCILAVLVCRQLGLLSLERFNTDNAKQWCPIAVLLVAQIYTGGKALQSLSVPVFTIFKNLTIIVIAYGEVLLSGGRVAPLVLLSFGLMVLSSMVAAWADVRATTGADDPDDVSSALRTLNAGYAWMFANVFCAAAYVLGKGRLMKKLQTRDWDATFYSNLLSIPVLALGSLLAEDWSPANFARNFPEDARRGLVLGMVYSGAGAVSISYASTWCQRVTSSTTYAMVGALNKLPIAVSGLVFFDDAPATPGGVAAILLGFVSGLVYAGARVRERERASMTLPTRR